MTDFTNYPLPIKPLRFPLKGDETLNPIAGTDLVLVMRGPKTGKVHKIVTEEPRR